MNVHNSVPEHSTARRDHYWPIALALVALITFELIVTVRPYMVWGGDEAMYAMHARNIALGHPYGETPYVHNPRNLIHPAAPPPGLPLLLAPVYRLYGLDWIHFKSACVLAFGLFLLVFARLARERLTPVWALVAVAFIGLHPFTWMLREAIPTEFSFMFFSYTALLLVEPSLSGTGRKRALCAVGIAVCAALAYVTRSIGVVLFPAIVLASIYHTRKLINVGVIAAVAGYVLGWGIEQVYRPDLGTYVGYMDAFGIHTLENNAREYLIALRHFLEDRTYARTHAGIALGTSAVLLAVLGFAIRVRTRLSSFEIFAAAFTGLLAIYPVSLEPDRYSFPLWPLFVLYVLTACQWLGSFLKGGLRHAPAALLFAVLAANFLVAYSAIARAPVPASVAEDDAISSYISSHLPRNAVLIARKPTVVAVLTDRRSAIWPAQADDQALRDYMRSIGAEYILQDIDAAPDHALNGDVLDTFVARNVSALELQYSQGRYRLYRLRAHP